MLTAARLVLEAKEEFGNSTVVVVVDRTELEGQLAGWVERLLGEMQQQDISVWRAGSKEQLRELLATDRRGLIISMIHKFEGIDKDANARDNIYVFIYEAHRSVARELGTYLMAALPNSTIIGFTGTPIARREHGEGTFQDIRFRRRPGLPGQILDCRCRGVAGRSELRTTRSGPAPGTCG